MPGVKVLRKIQLGRETTSGTKGTINSLWRGDGVLEDARDLKFVSEDIGIIGGVGRVVEAKQLAKIQFAEAGATFEQLPIPLTASLKACHTGVADGVGSGKVFTFPFPSTGVNDFDTYSIEGGDNQQEEEGTFFFVEQIKISGKSGEPVKVSVDWLGRTVTPGTFTTSVAIPSVEDMLFGKCKLYVDPVTNTYGQTQKTMTFLGFEVTIKTGLVAVWTGDGYTYLSFAKQTEPDIKAKVTFEHDTTGVSEKLNWRNHTPRLLRVSCDGSALTTAGTYTTRKMLIDIPGTWEKFDKLGEINGNDVVAGNLNQHYNTTISDSGKIVIVNEVASV
jgi:hypothetical protein